MNGKCSTALFDMNRLSETFASFMYSLLPKELTFKNHLQCIYSVASRISCNYKRALISAQPRKCIFLHIGACVGGWGAEGMGFQLWPCQERRPTFNVIPEHDLSEAFAVLKS